ncbi:hypothetical protein CYMTET_52347 [Cymbomonas tetramitiformis]|uniref:Uncharacterized protein n=1 Tax=Cymbomonas tetramitiformis TaxID=36881 RepID=A0AAE0BKV5_9CHLO|nr:hypothetical protein CYMTET_52347 [Cymbomonas tetramitiformis]
MASLRQRARMAAVRSALDLLRQRHLPLDCSLVVPSGAYTPSTKLESIAFAINNECFDSFDFVPPPPSPSPCTPPLDRLVVCGDVATPTSPLSIIPFEFLPMASIAFPHRIFHLPPPYPLFSDAFALVVPGRFWLWHRVGIG